MPPNEKFPNIILDNKTVFYLERKMYKFALIKPLLFTVILYLKFKTNHAFKTETLIDVSEDS